MTVLEYWLTPIGWGFVCQGISLLFPFRKMDAKAAHVWNVVGVFEHYTFAFIFAWDRLFGAFQA